LEIRGAVSVEIGKKRAAGMADLALRAREARRPYPFQPGLEPTKVDGVVPRGEVGDPIGGGSAAGIDAAGEPEAV
jgi:hypothetical protein